MQNRYLIMIVGVSVLLAGCGKKEVESVDKKEVPVKVETAVIREFKENIKVDGSVESKQVAMVTPRLPGTITELFVEEGDEVEQGTPLFSVDSVKMEQAVVSAERALAVAKCSVEEKKALKEQAEAVLTKADIDYRRQKKLYDEKDIGTADTIERLESALIQAKASVKHVETLINLSEEQVVQAEAALQIAKKDLEDTIIKAPISGVISVKFHDVGDMGTPGVPVFKIENNNQLEASFYIPSEFYTSVTTNNTVKIFSNGKEVGNYIISYKAPSIDNMLRVFEVKAYLGKNDLVAPGSLINGVITLKNFEQLGVPLKSVVKKQVGDVVFLSKDGLAKEVPVELGIEYDGWVAVDGDSIKPGDAVIVEGQFLLNDGSLISEYK